jgi:hypothetical protein
MRLNRMYPEVVFQLETQHVYYQIVEKLKVLASLHQDENQAQIDIEFTSSLTVTIEPVEQDKAGFPKWTIHSLDSRNDRLLTKLIRVRCSIKSNESSELVTEPFIVDATDAKTLIDTIRKWALEYAQVRITPLPIPTVQDESA